MSGIKEDDPASSFPGGMTERGLVSSRYHLPYYPKLVERAKELRQKMTRAEKTLWYKFLRGFPFRVLRQRPINHYIVDFYCPKLKLVIEIDGDQHITEDGKSYDNERTAVLNSYGLVVIRFTNDEIERNFETVCQKISSYLAKE